MRTPLMILALLCLSKVATADAGAELERAKELSQSMQLSDLEQSISIYEQLLERDPDDFDLLVGAAATMNKLMGIATNQNLPYIEDGDLELADSDRNKKIWRKWSERATEYAKKAVEMRPNDIEAAFAYANAYTFRSSSMGIVSAIMKGAAGTYKDNAQRLIRLDPDYDAGVGYFLLAAFYLVAPWPMSDDEESRKYLEKALSVAPNSLRNHYLKGLLEFEEENWDAAQTAFQWVIDHRCKSESERQVCGFLKKRSKIALKEVAEERD